MNYLFDATIIPNAVQLSIEDYQSWTIADIIIITSLYKCRECPFFHYHTDQFTLILN